MERVGDDAVGAVEEEEVGEWGLEDGGVGEGRSGHVDGGDGVEVLAGGEREGVEVDVEAGVLVASDGVLEDDGVVGDGDDGGFDAMGGEDSGEVDHGD